MAAPVEICLATRKGLFEPGHTFVYDAFPLDIDWSGASAWTAQALSALRRGAAVFRLVPARTVFNLRFGLRTQSR